MHLDHASTTLLYFSPLVINPSEYCVSYSAINFLVSSINFVLLSGITKSSLPNDIPALNACLKPKSFNLSQKMTVVFWPQNLNTTSIISETTFFGNNLSTNENLMLWFFGNKFANKNLPAVDVYFSYFLLPFSSTVSNLDIIVLWTLICPDDKANSIWSESVKYPVDFSETGSWDK